MTENRIEFRGVWKKLGKNQVLIHIDLSVSAGEVIGIVGSNGSGKTTLLRLVTGLLYPDKGQVWVAGKQIRPGLVGELPVSVGALIESPSFLPHFSGMQNLNMLAGIRRKIDKQTVQATIQRVGLELNRKPVRTYSLGMRQRLGIAQAIMETPEVLLFDEPTNGLDEEGVEMFSKIIEEQTQQGAAVILVSHNREEINRFCDRVFMMKNGELHPVRREAPYE